MRSKTKIRDAVFSTRRVEALTDGVFAIAMTLLVLDLKPSGLGLAATSAELWQKLITLDSGLVSFTISFLLLGSMWGVHMRQFEYIQRTDRRLTMINTIRLLVVVLIPLTTSMASTFASLVLGRILLPLNFLALAIVSFWEWNYAVASANNLHNGVEAELLTASRQRNQGILVTSVMTVVLSIWIGELAFLSFILLPVVMRLIANPITDRS